MATFSFANLDNDFSLEDLLVTFTGGTVFQAGPTTFSYSSAEDHGIVLFGNNFKYSGGNPISGTVFSFLMDQNNENTEDLSVSGLSFAFALLDDLTDGSLDAKGQNDLYWRTVLSGNDFINFGSNATSLDFDIDFAGDGRNVGEGVTLFGGDDTMTGDIGVDGYAQGDVENVLAGGTVYGGNDTISVNNGQITGDTYLVSGFLVGGDDTLSGGSATIFVGGDAKTISLNGFVTGGHDLITVTGTTDTSGDVNSLFGDVGALAYLAGGNDTITAVGNGANVIVGDAFSIIHGRMAGGDDIIRAGGGADVIYGDWQSLNATGQASGGDDKLYGEAGTDSIYGNDGNDLLDGGSGLDNLFGGQGNDIYVIDNPGDVVDESVAGSNGTDAVKSSVLNVDLTNTSLIKGDIENITLEGALNLSATGNGLANTLNGNASNNTLSGGIGNDTLNGGAGNDTLNGGSENDALNGGSGNDVFSGASGNDTLVGGSGFDVFVFSSSLGSTNIDIIQGFNHTDDVIQLDNDVFTEAGPIGALSAGFFYAGTAAHDANDRVIYNAATNSLLYDADGLGGVAAVRFATITGIVGGLTTADFAVIG